MPIYITDNSDNINGRVKSTIGSFDCGISGTFTATPLGSFDGNFSRSLKPFTCSYRGQFSSGTPADPSAYPRLWAPRIGTRNWGDDPFQSDTSTNPGAWNQTLYDNEREHMLKTSFAVINGILSGGSAGNIAAVEQLLTYRDANYPNVNVYQYFDLQEAGLSGTVGAKLDAETGPNGLLDWWVYDDYTAGAGANKCTSYPGSYHTNLTDQVIPDSNGQIFPEWYSTFWTVPILNNFNSPGNVRLEVYNDVTDHRHRALPSYSPGSDFDYNGNGVADNGRTNWNVAGTEGQQQAEKYRQGHRIYFDQLRLDVPGINVICNATTWGMESPDENFCATWYNSPHTFYDQAAAGAWMEGQVQTYYDEDNPANRENHPFSGVTVNSTGVVTKAFGSWRMAMNQHMTHIMWNRSPNHSGNHWATYISNTGPVSEANVSGGAALGDEINPLVGSNILAENMAVMRWGLASTLLDDGYFGCNNARRQHNSMPFFDEYGWINSGTTGITDVGWLGAALDDPLHIREIALNGSGRWLGSTDSFAVFYRRFENGLAIVNTSKTPSNWYVIPVDDNATDFSGGSIPGNVYKHINGAQDPSVNDGSVINETNYPSGYTLKGADGRILQTV